MAKQKKVKAVVAEEPNPPPAAPDKMTEPEVTTVTPEPEPAEFPPAGADPLGIGGPVTGEITVVGRTEPEPAAVGVLNPNPWQPSGWYPVTVVSKLSAVFTPFEGKVKRERAAGPGSKPRIVWEGHPITKVIRTLGGMGYNTRQICAGFNRLGLDVSKNTVNTEVGHGRYGEGEKAELTPDQENTLIDAIERID